MSEKKVSTKKVSMDDIVSLCKRRGFIYQGSEVYGGLAGTWDYGPLGVTLKRNIMNLWWKMFVEDRDDMYGVDAAILMNQKVWKASGHVDTFTDPLVECSNCNGRFREDKIDTSKCPTCGTKNPFGPAKQFNMMFKTNVGPVSDENSVSYLRPETAQGIFTNFKNVVDSFSPDLPFGIGQQGKAFRNEISPRDFVFRSREFEQMEIEYFIDEKNWEAEFEKWRLNVHEWLDALGLAKESVHELDVPKEDLAHYSKRTIDFEFDYPHGRDELLGMAYRTAFDLTNVQRDSGKSMLFRPKDGSEPFIPHVIEPSFGVERAVMAVLVSAYKEDEINDLQLFDAVGCSSCNEGYKGRVGIYQVMPITEDIAKIVLAGGNALQIADAARKSGINDLRASALLKAKHGVTSLAEINRVTKD